MNPKTDLEARVLRVQAAFSLCWCGSQSAYDWAHIFSCVISEAGPWNVNGNSNFYKYTLMKRPEVWQLLRPFIQLTSSAETKMLAKHAEITGQNAAEKHD